MIYPDALAENQDWTKVRTWDLGTDAEEVARRMGHPQVWANFKSKPAFRACPPGLEERVDAVFEQMKEFNVRQPRWPKGTHLGGQWKSIGAVLDDVRTDIDPDDVDVQEMQDIAAQIVEQNMLIANRELFPEFMMYWNGDVIHDDDGPETALAFKAPSCSIHIRDYLFKQWKVYGPEVFHDTLLHEMLHSGVHIDSGDMDPTPRWMAGISERAFEEGVVTGYTLHWGDEYLEKSQTKYTTPENFRDYVAHKYAETPVTTYMDMVNFLDRFAEPFGMSKREFYRWALTVPLDKRAEELARKTLDGYAKGKIDKATAADLLSGHMGLDQQTLAAAFMYEGYQGEAVHELANVYGTRFVESPWPIVAALPEDEIEKVFEEFEPEFSEVTAKLEARWAQRLPGNVQMIEIEDFLRGLGEYDDDDDE